MNCSHIYRITSDGSKTKNNVAAAFSLAFDFTVVVQNTGHSPADDLDVTLIFPSTLHFLSCTDEHVGESAELAPEPDPPAADNAGAVLPLSYHNFKCPR